MVLWQRFWAISIMIIHKYSKWMHLANAKPHSSDNWHPPLAVLCRSAIKGLLFFDFIGFVRFSQNSQETTLLVQASKAQTARMFKGSTQTEDGRWDVSRWHRVTKVVFWLMIHAALVRCHPSRIACSSPHKSPTSFPKRGLDMAGRAASEQAMSKAPPADSRF